MHGLGLSHSVRGGGIGKYLYAGRRIVSLLFSLLGGSGVPVRTEAELWAHMGFFVKIVGKGKLEGVRGKQPQRVLGFSMFDSRTVK